MGKLSTLIKDWILPIAIVAGVAEYLIYKGIPSLAPVGPYIYRAIAILQPVLLFIMLFLSFCQISPKDMRPRKWQLYLIFFQAIVFIALVIVKMITPPGEWTVILESAMLMLICPTATAAAVITGKLDGDMPGIVTYLVLINLVVAVLVPLLVPLIHPSNEISFMLAFSIILAKIFPLLICPCLLAWIVRYIMPKFHRTLVKCKDVSFYIWVVSLMLAILMSTHSIFHSTVSVNYQIGIAVVSLLCCVLQFAVGKWIGKRYGASVTAGQALGQKNTVFAIWMGYTFMTPVTSIAGGFYSIWHNVINSWQLYRHEHNNLPIDSKVGTKSEDQEY